MDNIEEMLGNVVGKYKLESKNMEDKNYPLIDQFDSQLYQTLLELRGKNNMFVPYDKDPSILTDIQNNIYEFIRKFMTTYSKEISPNFKSFLFEIKNNIDNWKTKQMNEINMQPQISILPLQAKNLNMTINHVIEGQEQKNDLDQEQEEGDKNYEQKDKQNEEEEEKQNEENKENEEEAERKLVNKDPFDKTETIDNSESTNNTVQEKNQPQI
jgi:hypothetical protein